MGPGQGAQGRQLACAGAARAGAGRLARRRGLEQARAAGQVRRAMSVSAPAVLPDLPVLPRRVPRTQTRARPDPAELPSPPTPAQPRPDLTCPSLASPAARRAAAAALQTSSRRRPDAAAPAPGQARSLGSARFGSVRGCPARRLRRRPRRWRGAGGGWGAGGRARWQVRAERGALCGGCAETAVRAAPARARSATPHTPGDPRGVREAGPASRPPLDLREPLWGFRPGGPQSPHPVHPRPSISQSGHAGHVPGPRQTTHHQHHHLHSARKSFLFLHLSPVVPKQGEWGPVHACVRG